MPRLWDIVRYDAENCTRCDLFRGTTQTVFGEGPPDAAMMLMGDIPDEEEDRAGRPFVGPAGQMLDRAMADAGIDRGSVYLTNAVKHFKFEQRGPRRFHLRPDRDEIEACKWWYEQERKLLRPRVTVALGVTAARQMLGKTVLITATRGRAFELGDDGAGGLGCVTIHPTFLLHIADPERADEEYAAFVEDLRAAKLLLG